MDSLCILNRCGVWCTHCVEFVSVTYIKDYPLLIMILFYSVDLFYLLYLLLHLLSFVDDNLNAILSRCFTSDI